MQLLVSVRSAAEVEPALTGGADIIDAKEPGRGSLGAVARDVLAEIIARVPTDRAVSVALGDTANAAEVAAIISALELLPRSAPIFLKLGFAGVRSADLVHRMIAGAVATAAALRAGPLVVAVAYADADRAGSLPPAVILGLAHEAGAAGVLLDTHIKDGMSLLGWHRPDELAEWVSSARQVGLLTGLAGGLGMEDVEAVALARPDVLGFRGAACIGGRQGRVAVDRVRGLHARLGEASAYVPG